MKTPLRRTGAGIEVSNRRRSSAALPFLLPLAVSAALRRVKTAEQEQAQTACRAAASGRRPAQSSQRHRRGVRAKGIQLCISSHEMSIIP